MTAAEKDPAQSGESQQSGEENRTHRRRSVLWPAVLTVGRHEFNCQIWNMSLGGARIRVDLPLEHGSSVTLSIAGRDAVPAEVVWHRGDALGVAFRVPPHTIKRMFADRLHVLGLDDEV
ncbi:PilZ domain-containing protein [Kordiimonas marina]|uniref:PilZ domain-containing protein n=1 Tax=Kordiimonas marina TaxID=2872312 RepID=UPI001FF4C912|nr:PilZ domain-containing protein [Kordiimonas marina]MCJ9429925.1 PilZ domain-containing protein [Kordiimonas marina]